MNLVSVVDELSRTHALGNSLLPDPLQNIPEARPVLRPKVDFIAFTQPDSLKRQRSRNMIQPQTRLLIPLTPLNKRFHSTLKSSVNTLDSSSSPVVSSPMTLPLDKSCLKIPYTRRRLSVSSTKRKFSTDSGWETEALRVHISRGGCGNGIRSCRRG